MATASPVDNEGEEKKDSGGGFFADLLKMIKDFGAKIMGILEFLGPLLSIGAAALEGLAAFLISPIGVGLLAAVVAGTIGAWMFNKIKEDPQAALAGKGGTGMAVAGLGSEGQLPSVEDEEKDKTEKKKAEAVDKKGINKATLEELEAKRQLLIDYGDPRSRVKKGQGDDADKIKAKQLDYIQTEIATRKKESASTSSSATSSPTQTPAAAGTPGAPGAPGASATPAATSTGSSATPVKKSDMSATPSSTASASPVPPVKSSGASATPEASSTSTPPAASTAAPIPMPKQSDVKLQQASKENADLNLEKNAGGSGGSSPIMVNNSNTTNAPPKSGMTTPESMYNSDPSFRDSVKSSFSRMLG
jgi:hypothetical protein